MIVLWQNNFLRFLVFNSLLLLLLLFGDFNEVQCDSLEEKLKSDPDISEFYSYLEQCKICNNTLESEEMTVFAPINAAFQKITTKNFESNSMVLYHIINIPKRTEEFGTSQTPTYLSSRLSGSPPLWITQSSSRFFNDIYVNNAKILISESNTIGFRGPLQQIMHKIDDVLIPIRANGIYNPNAWEFLNNLVSIIPGDIRARTFQQRIEQNHKQSIFQTEGSFTFFIPVDSGFNKVQASLIDATIIDGHVIPNHVLFTTPTTKDVPFETLANRDNIMRVVISFTQELRGNRLLNYVKSHTLLSEAKHPRGVVLAEIVKANIPVKNGVVHLISKPLMVVESTVGQMIQEHMDNICLVGNVQRMENVVQEPLPSLHYPEQSDYAMLPNLPDYKDQDGGILNSFFSALETLEGKKNEFEKVLEGANKVTLFVPCNAAWENNFQHLTNNPDKLLEILRLHIVPDSLLYVDFAQRQNDKKIFNIPTMAKGKNLFFNVVTTGPNKTMTVDGDGVNATVIQSDLVAKNGIIHIIDRVLGVPYATVYDKLKSDEGLNETYALGQYHGFNDQLRDHTKLFTYFVPRNEAWTHAKVIMPSAIKVLFMKDFSYHATHTLERHLIISDTEVYTMERIKQLSKLNSTVSPAVPNVELRTVRGSLKLYVEEKPHSNGNTSDTVNTTYVIHWNEEEIPVYRPNIRCTNGIIHVIDAPFLNKGDITTGFATKLTSSINLYIFTTVILITAFTSK